MNDQYQKIKLIWRCAWCSRKFDPKLNPNESYTSGVCKKHFDELMYDLKKNRGQQLG